MPYTLHHELSDGTLDTAACSLRTKKLALQVARKVAADKPWGISNIVVCKDDMAVATFFIRPFGVDE